MDWGVHLRRKSPSGFPDGGFMPPIVYTAFWPFCQQGDYGLFFTWRNAYLDMNDYDKAITDFDHALRLDPDYITSGNIIWKLFVVNNGVARLFLKPPIQTILQSFPFRCIIEE
jgi:tetratricopeptide (TPR) repeat protein